MCPRVEDDILYHEKIKTKNLLGSHDCDEFDESNHFRELAEFGSSLFPDHVKLAGRNQ